MVEACVLRSVKCQRDAIYTFTYIGIIGNTSKCAILSQKAPQSARKISLRRGGLRKRLLTTGLKTLEPSATYRPFHVVVNDCLDHQCHTRPPRTTTHKFRTKSTEATVGQNGYILVAYSISYRREPNSRISVVD